MILFSSSCRQNVNQCIYCTNQSWRRLEMFRYEIQVVMFKFLNSSKDLSGFISGLIPSAGRKHLPSCSCGFAPSFFSGALIQSRVRRDTAAGIWQTTNPLPTWAWRDWRNSTERSWASSRKWFVTPLKWATWAASSFGLLEFQGQIPDVKSRFWMTQSYVFLCTIDITQTLGKNHIESTDTWDSCWIGMTLLIQGITNCTIPTRPLASAQTDPAKWSWNPLGSRSLLTMNRCL